MKKIKYILSFFLIFNTLSYSYSQNTQYKSEDDMKKAASKMFEEKNFKDATPLYAQLLSMYPKDPDYNFRYGTCLLFSDTNKSKALAYLEFAVTRPSVDKRAFYYMGKAYHLNYHFDKAIKFYKKFEEKSSAKEKEELDVERQIEMCNNAKKLLQSITEVAVLDKKLVNKADFFRSYYLEGIGGKIIVLPDEYKSKEDKKLNNRSLMYFSQDANELFFASYGDDGKNKKDIYRIVKMDNGKWSKAQKIKGYVNTKYDEDFPYLHPNGKILYFCSKGHNSIGGYDIFRSFLNESTGEWSEPENLGFGINSPDDDILFISDIDNKLAYFASSRYSPANYIEVFKVMVQSKPEANQVIKGKFIAENNPVLKKAKITINDVNSNKKIGVFNTDKNGNYIIVLPTGGKYKFIVETLKDSPIHTGIVDVPSKKYMQLLKQELRLIGKGDNEQLIIKNMFEEGSPEEILAFTDILQKKAKLEVNTNEEDLDSIKIEASVTEQNIASSLEDIKATAEVILNLAQETALSLQDLSNKLKEKKDKAIVLANAKNKEAREKKLKAELLNNEIANENNPDSLQKKVKLADKYEKEAQEAAKEAILSFNLAKEYEKKYQKAAKESDNAQFFVKQLQDAFNNEDINKLSEWTAKKDEFLSDPENFSNPEKDIIENKKNELFAANAAYNEEMEKIDNLQKQANDIQNKIKQLNIEKNNTKKKKEKANIQNKINSLQMDLDDIQFQIENRQKHLNELNKELNKKQKELSSLSTFIQNDFNNIDVSDFPEKADMIPEKKLSDDIALLQQEIKGNKYLQNEITYNYNDNNKNLNNNNVLQQNNENITQIENKDTSYYTVNNNLDEINKKYNNKEKEILAISNEEEKNKKELELKKNWKKELEIAMNSIDAEITKSNDPETKNNLLKEKTKIQSKILNLTNDINKLSTTVSSNEVTENNPQNQNLNIDRTNESIENIVETQTNKEQITGEENDLDKYLLVNYKDNFDYNPEIKQELKKTKSLKEDAYNLLKQSEDIKKQAANASTSEEKKRLFNKSEELKKESYNKQFELAKIYQKANEQEYLANKQHLSKLKESFAGSVNEDAAFAEMLIDEAQHYFNEAKKYRQEAENASSYIIKEQAIKEAYKNEMIAISKQKEAIKHYKETGSPIVNNILAEKVDINFNIAENTYSTQKENVKKENEKQPTNETVERNEKKESNITTNKEKEYKNIFKIDKEAPIVLEKANAISNKEIYTVKADFYNQMAEKYVDSASTVKKKKIKDALIQNAEKYRKLAYETQNEANNFEKQSKKEPDYIVINGTKQNINEYINDELTAFSKKFKEETNEIDKNRKEILKQSEQYKDYENNKNKAQQIYKSAMISYAQSMDEQAKANALYQATKKIEQALDTISNPKKKEILKNKIFTMKIEAINHIAKADSLQKNAEKLIKNAIVLQEQSNKKYEELLEIGPEELLVINQNLLNEVKVQTTENIDTISQKQNELALNTKEEPNNTNIENKIETNKNIKPLPTTLSIYNKVKVNKIPDFVNKNSGEIFGFINKNNSAYNDKNPIPINPPPEKGLIFKVQIGAFKSKIPNDVFKGFAPIVGENTSLPGITRYLAGYFKSFNNANQAKESIRKLGYKDAFVVAYLDGKRISINKAREIENKEIGVTALLNKEGENEIKINENPKLVSNQGVPKELKETLPATNILSIESMFFTIQVGAFSKAIDAYTQFKMQPLFTKQSNNGLWKYTIGIFDDINKASNAKDLIVAQGINDAFIVAYYNGERISLEKAKQLISQKGKNILIQSPTINKMIIKGKKIQF